MIIKKNDILTVDKYIYEALYNINSGYYMKNNPFGKNGDYITAPNISILYSEISNSIIATVGNYPITRFDLIKEIKLVTILSNINLNENNKEQT